METYVLLTSILEAALVGLSIYLIYSRRRIQQELSRRIQAAETTDTRLNALEDRQHEEAHTFRQTEQKLRSYLYLMDTLVNTLPNPFFYKDTDGIYLGCNQVFAKDILGISRDRIIGYTNKVFSDRMPADLMKSLEKYERRLVKTRSVDSFEAQMTCADGSQRDFLFYIAPVVQKDDEMTGSIGVMLDLTEKNLATRERIQKEKFQGVLETAGAVCHELNQPLQVLTGYADFILLETPGKTMSPEFAHQIQEQVDRIADITKKLQDITHYETKTYGDQLKIIDIHKASRSEEK